MPNWCDTTYKCVGDRKQVQELHRAIQSIERRKTPLIENGFGKLWLGCLVSKLGFDWNDYRCRGEITDYYLEGDVLTIYQSTAWCEQEGVRECIEKKFPGIKVYYLEEEPGMCLYMTNDRNGDYFTERYLIDSYDGPEYYDTLEDVAKEVSELTGKEVKADRKEIVEALEQHQRLQDEDSFYYFHEIEVVES